MRVGPGGLGQETQETGGWRTREGAAAVSCPDVQGNSCSSLALITVTWTVSKERDKKGSRWPLTQRSGRRGPIWTCPSGIQAPSAASPGRAGVDPGGWPGRVQAHPKAAVTLVPSTPGHPAALPPTVCEWKGSKLPQSWNYWDFTCSDELSVEPSGLGGFLWVGSCQLSLFLKWRETTCADLALLRLVLVNWFS